MNQESSNTQVSWQKAGIDPENAAFLHALHLIEETERSVFVTGKAGTGKSTLVKVLRKYSKKQMIVLAPTGIAAINVKGQTIHSFFGFPPRPILPGDKDIKKFSRDSETYDLIRNADVLIIDEISMVRADLLDAVHYSLALNTGKRSRPFGGKQVVLIGDPFQLPPVVAGEEKQIIHFLYRSAYFFDANSFHREVMDIVRLEKIYRQEDDNYVYLLNQIRNGTFNSTDLEQLNSRHFPNYKPSSDTYIITLCATNAAADKVNFEQLASLPGKESVYEGEIDGKFPKGSLPTSTKIRLKKGAQVIFVRNDPEGKFVNGIIGKVEELDDKYVLVRLENDETCVVEPHTWENISYKWDLESGKIDQHVEGTFKQLPLKLAWAITIHKSQGLTFDRCIVDLGRGAFAHGQLYVALSRCRSLKGLVLTQRIRHRDIIVDKAVAEAEKRGFLSADELRLI